MPKEIVHRITAGERLGIRKLLVLHASGVFRAAEL